MNRLSVSADVYYRAHTYLKDIKCDILYNHKAQPVDQPWFAPAGVIRVNGVIIVFENEDDMIVFKLKFGV